MFFFERIPNLPAANVIPNLVDSGLDQQNENWNEAERGAWGANTFRLAWTFPHRVWEVWKVRTGVVCVCWALPSTAGIWFVLSLWHRWKRRHWWKRVHESTWAQTDRDPGYSCHFLFSKRPFRCWIHSWQIFPPVSASELFEPAQHLGTVPPGLSPNVQTAIRNDVWRLRVPATQRTPGVFWSPALP